MKANPGGHIPSTEVIGRDDLIRTLWRTLERQSIVLNAERRMGKTSVVQKMTDEPRKDTLPIYRDLEEIYTPLEFAQSVFRDVEQYLGRMQRNAVKARKFLMNFSGAEVGGVFKIPDIAPHHWKELLDHTLDDFVNQQENMVILFWDELPLMLDNFQKHGNERDAMETLDVLRSLRQSHPKLRMVFTGSIGLHNILTVLRKAGHANDATNDMKNIEVTPLSPKSGSELALRILEGEGITADNLAEIATSISTEVDHLPYFIQHVIDQIAQRGTTANLDLIITIVNEALIDDQDCWHLRYYRQRIDSYYEPDSQTYALHLLDILSNAESPLSVDEIFNLLKSQMETEDKEKMRDVLAHLQRDHYLSRNTDGTFFFRFPIIRRWWIIDRGL